MTDIAPDPAPSHSLEDQLCFALYSASRAMTTRYRPLLEPLGLTYPQYLVMLVLWEHGTVSVRTLGEHLHLDSGTLSPMLQRLEAAGIVTRRRNDVDERSVDISPTEKGLALREAADDVPEQVGAACGMPMPALVELRESLNTLEGFLAGRVPAPAPAPPGQQAA